MRRRRFVAASLLTLLACGAAGSARAQDAEGVDPVRCWWRTSTSAVRVGEPFSLSLTCAVLENSTTTVVVDQSKLEPTALQIEPFEVMSGEHAPDLHSDQRRFFQYQYTVRLLADDLFDKDVKLPNLQIDYHIESRLAQGESVRGRDLGYNLPQQTMRVVTLVPGDASDIRDASSWTFGEIDSQRFKARVLFIGAGVLATAGALVLVFALVRAVRRRREESTVKRPLLSHTSLLRAAGRELTSVRRDRNVNGWTDDLVGRALAALRIAGSIALSAPVSQSRADGNQNGHRGQLLLRGGALWHRRVHVSGWATAEALRRELASEGAPANGLNRTLTDLQTALARFTAAQFTRDPSTRDETALDEAMTDGMSAIRRLQVRHFWPVRKLRNVTAFASGAGARAWSR